MRVAPLANPRRASSDSACSLQLPGGSCLPIVNRYVLLDSVRRDEYSRRVNYELKRSGSRAGRLEKPAHNVALGPYIRFCETNPNYFRTVYDVSFLFTIAYVSCSGVCIWVRSGKTNPFWGCLGWVWLPPKPIRTENGPKSSLWRKQKKKPVYLQTASWSSLRRSNSGCTNLSRQSGQMPCVNWASEWSAT